MSPLPWTARHLLVPLSPSVRPDQRPLAYAQFGRGGFFGFGAGRIATAQDFDGRFHYCRIVYRQSADGRDGSWRTDYPRADINFSIRFSELTKANVSFNAQHEPNHLLVNLGGPELFGCPVDHHVGTWRSVDQ